MNPLDRIGAVVSKEFRHLWRDPRAIAIVLLMPVVQLLASKDSAKGAGSIKTTSHSN